MPFALVFIGLVMVITGAKGTHKDLGNQLVADFTGPNNFLYWLAAIGAVGSLGYIPAMRPFSRVFMALIIIVMVIRNGGFFTEITKAIQLGPEHSAQPSEESTADVTAPGTTQSPTQSLEQHQSGFMGQSPTSPGQAKFNGWMNFLFGL